MPVRNNVGVAQGSPLSAILLVIYIDDMTQDRQSMNDQTQLPKRCSIRPKEEKRANQLLEQIAGPTESEDDKHIFPAEKQN